MCKEFYQRKHTISRAQYSENIQNAFEATTQVGSTKGGVFETGIN